MSTNLRTLIGFLACTADLLYASARGVMTGCVWNASHGQDAAPALLAVCWGYVLVNVGSILARSKAWRVAWSVLAAMANLIYAVFAIDLLSEPLAWGLGGVIVILVVLNSLAIAMSFRPRISTV